MSPKMAKQGTPKLHPFTKAMNKLGKTFLELWNQISSLRNVDFICKGMDKGALKNSGGPDKRQLRGDWRNHWT